MVLQTEQIVIYTVIAYTVLHELSKNDSGLYNCRHGLARLQKSCFIYYSRDHATQKMELAQVCHMVNTQQSSDIHAHDCVIGWQWL